MIIVINTFVFAPCWMFLIYDLTTSSTTSRNNVTLLKLNLLLNRKLESRANLCLVSVFPKTVLRWEIFRRFS